MLSLFKISRCLYFTLLVSTESFEVLGSEVWVRFWQIWELFVDPFCSHILLLSLVWLLYFLVSFVSILTRWCCGVILLCLVNDCRLKITMYICLLDSRYRVVMDIISMILILAMVCRRKTSRSPHPNYRLQRMLWPLMGLLFFICQWIRSNHGGSMLMYLKVGIGLQLLIQAARISTHCRHVRKVKQRRVGRGEGSVH